MVPTPAIFLRMELCASAQDFHSSTSSEEEDKEPTREQMQQIYDDDDVLSQMNAERATRAMKAMKKKKQVKKVSARLARRHVFAGKITKTGSGLAKGDLVKNKAGKIVSKKASAKGKKSPWIAACNAARKALNIKGFCAIKKGTPLYNKAKALYKK